MAILKRLPLLLSFVMLLGSLQILSAQGALSPLDSIVVESVPFSEIPSSMAQTKLKTATLLDNMVSVEAIVQRKLKNDTIAMDITDMLSDLTSRPQEQMTSRYIGNSQLEIKSKKAKVKDEVDKMSSFINAMDRTDSYIKDEIAIWDVTNEELVKESYSQNMLDHVSSVHSYLDSARQEIAARTEMIFFILELCTKTNVAMDEASLELEASLVKLEEMFATTKRPTVFHLDYSEDNIEFLTLITSYVRGVREDVNDYRELKQGRVISSIMIFLLFTYLFYTNRRKILKLQVDHNNYYQQKLGKMFKSPVSAALVLTLAIGSVMLRDRPLAVRNLMLYLSLFPLYIITSRVIRKSLRRYLIFFFLLIFPIVGFNIFPPNNIFFRFTLVFLAVCEFLIIGHFYLYQMRREDRPRSKGDKVARGMVYLLFSFVSVGLITAVLGKTMVAQVLLLTTFFSVFGAAILYSSSVMLNGLFITIIEGTRAKKVNAFAIYHSVIIKKFVGVINVLAVYLWIVLFLKQLKVWDAVYTSVMGFFQYEWTVGEMSINIGNVIIFFIVIYISTLLSRALQVILEGDILNKMNMASGMPHSIAVMARYTFVILGVLIAVSVIGFDFSNLAVVIGALGVGIGFGLQSIFNNLVSGLILLFERPIKIGDTVEIGELIGKVKTIGIRASNIHTIEGAEVIVPNGHLVSNEVINWTLSDQRRRIDVMVGVSYDSDPQQVKRILEGVLADHPMILQDPKPSVFFLEMGESSLDFRMLFWTSSYSEWYRIRSEVVMSTFETLKKNDIEIPFPQRDINIKRDPLLS